MYRFYSRQFLNLRGHHAGAYVLAFVERRADSDDHPWYNIALELADCSRRVEFEFPLYTAADRRNSVRKARLLADITARFADAVEAEAEFEARRPRRKRQSARSRV